MDLPVYEIETYIQKNLNNYIDSYSWITRPLDEFMKEKGFRSTYITHIGRIY